MVRRETRREAKAENRAPEEIERNLEPHLHVLGGLIAASGRTEAEIEADLDWPTNRIRDLLSRRRQLGYDDILAVLEAIGVEPRHYFMLYASSDNEH